MSSKRSYNSENRKNQASLTKSQILNAALLLFSNEGFENTTIAMLAHAAEVSEPTIYALFKSKKGVLKALMDSALPQQTFEEIVSQSMQEPSSSKRLDLTAKLARELYESEEGLAQILRGASFLNPELKKLDEEREKRRFLRQKAFVEKLYHEKELDSDLSIEEARDVLWTLTSREIYRLLVIERKWEGNHYQEYLGKILKRALLKDPFHSESS